MDRCDVIVIGGGHNGLVCACSLARAGLRVLVLERAERIGGAVHTAETIPAAPGHRFDTCSVVHNLINISSIRQELQLDELGLRYVETDPFSVQFLPDGSCVRFYRSVERTCQELARFSPRDAKAYARFIALADPLTDLGLAMFRLSEDDFRLGRELWRDLRAGLRALPQASPVSLARWMLGSYGPLLKEWPWPDAPPDVWNGLQSVAASVDQVHQNFVEAEAGVAPTNPAPYMYTLSAIDPSVAPGRHSAYIACASYPARWSDSSGWAERAEREAERLLDAFEARCPGFRDPGLYLSGAGTPPAGGVSGVPGRPAAKVLLFDRDRGRHGAERLSRS